MGSTEGSPGRRRYAIVFSTHFPSALDFESQVTVLQATACVKQYIVLSNTNNSCKNKKVQDHQIGGRLGKSLRDGYYLTLWACFTFSKQGITDKIFFFFHPSTNQAGMVILLDGLFLNVSVANQDSQCLWRETGSTVKEVWIWEFNRSGPMSPLLFISYMT